MTSNDVSRHYFCVNTICSLSGSLAHVDCILSAFEQQKVTESFLSGGVNATLRTKKNAVQKSSSMLSTLFLEKFHCIIHSYFTPHTF